MLKSIVLLLVLLIVSTSYAQNDSLIFIDDHSIAGSILSLSRGNLVIETDYSKNDLVIRWSRIKQIYTSGEHIIVLSDGERIIGNISTYHSDIDKVFIRSEDSTFYAGRTDVVYLQRVAEGFMRKWSASVDVGYTLTKANKLSQISLRSGVGYMSDNWNASASLNLVRSKQDSLSNTSRTDAMVGGQYTFFKNWFVLISTKFLQSTELKLKRRITPNISIGNFLIYTKTVYWNLDIGVALNNEEFTDPEIPQNSSNELRLGTELNLFDLGDLNILTNLILFHNLNDTDRYRANFRFDLKYKLTTEFYAAVGYTYNYDSKPVAGTSNNDYVFLTSLGWAL